MRIVLRGDGGGGRIYSLMAKSGPNLIVLIPPIRRESSQFSVFAKYKRCAGGYWAGV